MNRYLQPLILLALAGTTLAAAAQTSQSACDKAWTNYREFRQKNVMEESQYPLTEYGAAVRAACGAEALPVPPGSDTPHYRIIRKPAKPVKPAPHARPAPKPD